MKRRDLIRYLEQQGCEQVREGSEHIVYRNPATKKVSSVPRHHEINDITAERICKVLGIPKP